MERRVNGKVETYITNFKTNLCNKIKNIDLPPDNQKELLEYVYDYDRLCLTKEDFVKRKRTKNAIPGLNRCNAKRANGEQCTRRRKDDCEFCGTHEKGRPHGLITAINDNEKKMKKIEVFAKEIMGIVYSLDKNGNVYKTEDILKNIENPTILAKYEFVNDKYIIPEFGLF